jgi:hypothetical protein
LQSSVINSITYLIIPIISLYIRIHVLHFLCFPQCGDVSKEIYRHYEQCECSSNVAIFRKMINYKTSELYFLRFNIPGKIFNQFQGGCFLDWRLNFRFVRKLQLLCHATINKICLRAKILFCPTCILYPWSTGTIVLLLSYKFIIYLIYKIYAFIWKTS